MNALAEILQKRARLVARAEFERRALSEGIAGCARGVSLFERGVQWAKWLRSRPYLAIAAVVAITVLRPRILLRWGGSALALWRLGRLVFAAIRMVAPPKDRQRPSS
jgi:hypothetical protein